MEIYERHPGLKELVEDVMDEMAERGEIMHQPKPRRPGTKPVDPATISGPVVKEPSAKSDQLLDELQERAEKLVGLLKDRQVGLFCWHGLLCEQVQRMHEITSRMLGK